MSSTSAMSSSALSSQSVSSTSTTSIPSSSSRTLKKATRDNIEEALLAVSYCHLHFPMETSEWKIKHTVELFAEKGIDLSTDTLQAALDKRNEVLGEMLKEATKDLPGGPILPGDEWAETEEGQKVIGPKSDEKKQGTSKK